MTGPGTEREPPQPGGTRLGIAAAVLAASVLLSRVMGYLREMALAYEVGVGPSVDAYRAAFQLPDLLNYFLAGGAWTIAFLPLYARRQGAGDEAGARRLFATVLGTTGAAAVAATAALWWWADPLVALQFPRFAPETHELTVRLTRVVLPAQIFFVSGGILRAVLMAHGSFSAQALAPLLYNGAIVVGGLGLGMGIEGFAWGALFGAALAAGVAFVQLARRMRIRVRFAPRDRDFLEYLVVAAPLMFGVTLLTVDEWYDRWFGGLIGAGTVALLGYARVLMQVPVAVVGQAIATAALPTLSRLHSEGRGAELDRVLLGTLRAGGGLAVLCSGFFYACALPIVWLVYRRGAFMPADAHAAAGLLEIFALAVPGWVIQQIGVRGFYARGDTWRPMLLGTAVAVLVVPLYLTLGRELGAEGLAAAGALGMSAGALATLALLRRLHGGPSLGALFATLGRALLIALLAAAAAIAVRGEAVGDLASALLQLARSGLAFGVVAALGVWWLGDAPMRDAVARILRRLRLRR